MITFAALAGCQSATPEDALSVSAQVADAGPPEAQTVGSGPIRLAMLLPLSAEGTERDAAADYRDGAVLAMRDLGGNSATLTIYDTKGVPTEVTRLGKKALEAGAQVIIGPTTPGDVREVAGLASGKRPVVLALTPDIPLDAGDIFAIKSDEVDSANAVVSYAMAAGRNRFVVLAPEGYAASSLARIRTGIAQRHGRLAGTITYPEEAGAVAKAIAGHRNLIDRASAILLLAGRDTDSVVNALRDEKLVTAERPLLGTSSWPPTAISDKNADGVLIALPSQAGLRQIAVRFSAAFGRPPSPDAAYGYDAIAIVLGISRVMGPEALTAKTLLSDKGFRGASGVFRFNKDGSVDRLLTVYVDRGGAMKQVKAASKGF